MKAMQPHPRHSHQSEPVWVMYLQRPQLTPLPAQHLHLGNPELRGPALDASGESNEYVFQDVQVINVHRS